MRHIHLIIYTIISILLLQEGAYAQNKNIYKSPSLEIDSVAPGTYVHRTYLQTDEWGKVPCNGLVYVNSGEAIVFDTPSTDSVSTLLINWITNHTKARIKAIVVNHSHTDCLGGLHAFHQAGIASYSNITTIGIAKKNPGMKEYIPQHGFRNRQEIRIGKSVIINYYPGQGHTVDNIVSYIPAVNVLFGGCIIKSIGSSKGNLADANVKVWPHSVERIKKEFPNALIIIPGHGNYGNQTLLDYTIKLFTEQAVKNLGTDR